MFLKNLLIFTDDNVIRDIEFHNGINLIIDESKEHITGNNVGKTTVLKLIDYCLGAKSKQIYTDPENLKNEYKLVKNFLVDNNVQVKLTLVSDLSDKASKQITIHRNFLLRNKAIRKVNGKQLTIDEFETTLQNLIFPGHESDKPSFRQIISHNIRYKDESISNTLKTLNRFTTDEVYESLYLFLIGITFDDADRKQIILSKLKQERGYKKRLEKNQTKTAYETALSLIKDELDRLEQRKKNLNLNENFEFELNELSKIKYLINRASSELSNLNIRKDLIDEAKSDLDNNRAEVDLNQLKTIYQQATHHVENIHRTFEELVSYHNSMTNEKVKFITKDLPELKSNIAEKKESLRKLLVKETELSLSISKTDSYSELELIMSELSEASRKRGEYEKMVEQINEIEITISKYDEEIDKIDKKLFSNEFESQVKSQLDKFNKFFSKISNDLYGEQYALKYDKETDTNGKQVYKFTAFNINFSSGKKQGEISCFDIAYTFFADSESIPCLHFILNDKKELMHDNQLIKISNLVNNSNIQFVASILKDKLPRELNNKEYFVVELSEDEKLFKIEN